MSDELVTIDSARDVRWYQRSVTLGHLVIVVVIVCAFAGVSVWQSVQLTQRLHREQSARIMENQTLLAGLRHALDEARATGNKVAVLDCGKLNALRNNAVRLIHDQAVRAGRSARATLAAPASTPAEKTAAAANLHEIQAGVTNTERRLRLANCAPPF